MLSSASTAIAVDPGDRGLAMAPLRRWSSGATFVGGRDFHVPGGLHQGPGVQSARDRLRRGRVPASARRPGTNDAAWGANGPNSTESRSARFASRPPPAARRERYSPCSTNSSRAIATSSSSARERASPPGPPLAPPPRSSTGASQSSSTSSSRRSVPCRTHRRSRRSRHCTAPTCFARASRSPRSSMTTAASVRRSLSSPTR